MKGRATLTTLLLLWLVSGANSAFSGQYAKLDEDIKWYVTLAKTYDKAAHSIAIFRSDFSADSIEHLKRLYEGHDAVRDRFNTLSQSTYKDLIDQTNPASKGPEAQKLKTALDPAYRAIMRCRREREEYLKYAKKWFDENIRGARGALRDARRHNDVGRFEPDGRPKWLAEARNILDLTSALDPEDKAVLKAMNTEYKTVLEESRALYREIRPAIIAKTRTPDDRYRSPDKDDLSKAIKRAWQKRWKSDKIVGLRFHSLNWKTTTNWQWNNAQKDWLKNDVSVLPVTVVVENPDDDTALLLYLAYANKDHTKGDAISIGVETKGDGFVVREMLKSNYRP